MSETVQDICDEIGKWAARTDVQLLGYWPKVILAAHEREMAEKDAEIARLKAALKECEAAK